MSVTIRKLENSSRSESLEQLKDGEISQVPAVEWLIRDSITFVALVSLLSLTAWLFLR